MPWRIVVLAGLSFLTGCSLLGLGETPLPTCRTNVECAALPLGDPSCEVAVCRAGRCEVSAMDADADGDVLAGCPLLDGTDAVGGDCDDADPDRFTDQIEACNGIDDDCNTLLDGVDRDGEGEDDDGDLHPDRCAGIAASDCDDSSETGFDTFVGADELCDGFDNDCTINGVVRLSGGPMVEPSEDRDHDEHVAPDATCIDFDGGLPRDDCDDLRADVHPGAFEACDGADNDCDGVVDGTSPNGTGSACIPIDVAVGEDQSCVLRADGQVVCWGSNEDGGLGDPAAPEDAAVLVPGIVDAREIAVGRDFGCARGESGDVHCWGPEYMFRVAPATGLVPFGIGRVELSGPAVDLDAGDSREMCAALADGSVECWGYVHCGGAGPSPDEGTAFGLLETDPECPCMLIPQASIAPRRIELPPGFMATEVAVALQRACALAADGRAACWGHANVLVEGAGSLGDGVTLVSRAAVEVAVGGAAIDDVEAVALNRFTDCVLRASGELWCWGIGPSGGHPEPQRVASAEPLPPFVSLVGGGDVTCALDGAGTPYCFGAEEPIVGVGADRYEPRPLAPGPSLADAIALTNVSAVGLGRGHACAVLEGRGVSCWGDGAEYRLGDGRDHADLAWTPSDAAHDPLLPQPVSVTIPILAIHAGAYGTCFSLPDQTVRCQGDNKEIDIATTTHRFWTDLDNRTSSPSRLQTARQSFPAAIDVAVGLHRNSLGESHTCVVRPDGSLLCRGGNRSYQRELERTVTDATQVVAGDRFTCVLRRTGRVTCAGWTAGGRLGGVPSEALSCPGRSCSAGVEVEGLREVVAIGAGDQHACALDAEGRVYCWGENERGQLGSRPVANAATPREVMLPERASTLAVGGRSACVTTEGRDTYCWGDVVAPASNRPSPIPERVLGFSEASRVAITKGAENEGDRDSACALFLSGQVRCIGDGALGQLGDGTPRPEPTLDPVLVANLFDAVAIECGDNHCCAVRSSGQAVCWGSNSHSQLGNDDRDDRAAVPSPRSTASLMRPLGLDDPGYGPTSLVEEE